MIKAERKPKYIKIADTLRREIEDGRFGVNEKLPSFTDLRERYGATPTTANQVYGVLEQQGLVVREPGRGIFVAEPPQRLRTSTIGIAGRAFTQDHQVPYWSYLMQGVRLAAEQQGVEILLLNEKRPAPGWEKVDGVLLCSAADNLYPQLPPGMACVSVINPSRDVPNVLANDHEGARQATQHLLQLGHRRIGFLLPQPEHWIEARRLAGYQAALWEAGIEPDTRWVRSLHNGWGESRLFDELGREQMAQWLEDDWNELDCTALLTENDEMAMGVMETLQAADICVPDDVSVIGFDGTKMGEYFRPRLTTVEVPLRHIGRRGVELLLAQIDGRQVPNKSEVLPVRLIERESTAAPRTPFTKANFLKRKEDD